MQKSEDPQKKTPQNFCLQEIEKNTQTANQSAQKKTQKIQQENRENRKKENTHKKNQKISLEKKGLKKST